MRRGAIRASAIGACTAIASLACGLWIPIPANAIDYQPFDWVGLPSGTNVAMLYYQYGTRSAFNNMITGPAGPDTHLESHLGVARYLRYQSIFDRLFVFDLILPFGALTNGRLSGVRLDDAAGIADPLVSVGVWLINEPEQQRYLSAATFLSIPVGTYDNRRTLNLGANRWQNDLQVDFTQGFLGRFTLDVSASWTWYGDNTHAGIGYQTLSQDSSFNTYAWLTWDISAQRQAFLSIGYAGTFGGAQRLDGVPLGTRTEEHQIRLSYLQYLTPTLQGIVSVSHDVAAYGQFRQDFGLLMRLAKVF